MNLFFDKVSAIGCLMLMISICSSGLGMPLVPSSHPNDINSLKKQIKNALDTLNPENYILDEEIRGQLFEELKRFYKFNGYKLEWSNVEGPLASCEILFGQLSTCDEDGMNPEDYHVPYLQDLQDEVFAYLDRNPSAVIALDLKITAMYLTYAWHVYNGRNRPKNNLNWLSKPRNLHLAQYLARKDISKSLKELVPESRQYRKLKSFLAEYRRLQDKGGWIPISLSGGGYLKIGDTDAAVPQIKQRLAYTSDISLKIRDVHNTYFDENLDAAIRRFQHRHGLREDGIVGGETLRALNVPLEERISQIKINLDRWRVMSRMAPSECIIINIPEYRLYAYDDRGNIPLRLKVLVGTVENLTPVFDDNIEYVIFRPSETSLIINDGYLEQAKPTSPLNLNYRSEMGQNYEKVRREKHDADFGTTVGLFSMNKTDTYSLCLSDPAITKLFQKPNRSLSRGSIIIETPKLLASYLLKRQRKWNNNKIEKHMGDEDYAVVPLEKEVPIHVAYHTSWVGKDNLLNFRRDIYHFDAPLIEQLSKESREASEY